MLHATAWDSLLWICLRDNSFPRMFNTALHVRKITVLRQTIMLRLDNSRFVFNQDF